MTDEGQAGANVLDPDVSEEELGTEIDNIVPTRGYHSTRVVGLGGSAGSIGALQSFFTRMPSPNGMAFVVVLHLSPEHDSVLTEILQRSTGMRVLPASDGQHVDVDHVYVIPPGKHLSMVDGHLRLSELPHHSGRHLTVDLFFRSLADTHGPHAVGIVLSGGDGDGALGIKRLKERGGLTIAQDPEAAEHAGMPRAAIATSMVDWVLSAEEMPERLLRYHQREKVLQILPESGPNPAAPPSSGSVEEAALRDVLAFLRTRTGRDFSYYKRATIVRRISRRMQVNEVDSMAAYLTFLRTHPGEAGALLQDMLISVTNFFRDREAFEALERRIPELFKNKTQADVLRVWVPACATGEEAYSIAILLAEHARTLEAPPVIQIFATDLDEEVLLGARNCVYPEAIAADVSVERLRRYFIKEHHGYRVRRELREMLLFAVHDLLKDSPFSRLDLISCRNLLIYLNRGAQRRAFDIFHFALRSEGMLLLGASESVEDGSQHFYALDKKHRIYVARGSARPSLPVPLGYGTLARSLVVHEGEPTATLALKAAPSQHAMASALRASQERLSWGELHLKLIERVGPPSLIVNGQHDILHMSQSVTPFLQFSGGEPTSNLLRLVHPMLRVELRAALFRVTQGGGTAVAQSLPMQLPDGNRLVDIRVSPAADLAPDFALVTFEVHPQGEALPPAPPAAEEPIVRHLERELEQTKRSLRDILEQHEASTEELKASNEELQAMNEELRSATEELETSREELQSINEELTTVNQELKGKVDELGHSNSDLHNLMGATAIATVFLDRQLRIMRFTPPAVEIFNLIPTDVGRPLANLQHIIAYPELLADAARVLERLAPVEREVLVGEDKVFLVRILPYRTTEDRIAGVVLTLVDVTERHAAQAALHRVQEELEKRVRERTAEFDAVNAKLRSEIEGHERARRAAQELQRRLLHAQEEERSRISRELHDEVGQQVAALMMALKGLESAPAAGDAAPKLAQLREATERMAREIHHLAAELRPVALDRQGLVGALSGYLEGWLGRSGLAVDFVSAGLDEARLPPQIETALYRIIQEALNNVYKHAAARRVSVSIQRRGDSVIAIVEDDGRGFGVEAENSSVDGPHLGIAGMRERVTIVGGELTVESCPGAGTTVRVKLPV